ncbi:MAG: hypothetical protein ACRCWM_09525 [Sarcina sp.]
MRDNYFNNQKIVKSIKAELTEKLNCVEELVKMDADRDVYLSRIYEDVVLVASSRIDILSQASPGIEQKDEK